jgi:hypothetical protein
MHLVNILRIITFSFLVGHSILTISDFNGFRFFWDTLYSNLILFKKITMQYHFVFVLPIHADLHQFRRRNSSQEIVSAKYVNTDGCTWVILYWIFKNRIVKYRTDFNSLIYLSPCEHFRQEKALVKSGLSIVIGNTTRRAKKHVQINSYKENLACVFKHDFNAVGRIFSRILYKFIVLMAVSSFIVKANLHYTTLPKIVACNLLTTWVVLCKSSIQLTYVVVDESCAWFTQCNSSCQQGACDSFRRKLCSVNLPSFYSNCAAWFKS